MKSHFKALAPAKINLNLYVLGARDDGYHNIVSVMQKIGLADEVGVHVTDGRGVRILSDNPSVPTDEANLAFQAAELLLKNVGRSLGVRITLKKRIPMGAGLGGGSTDAAQTILLLNQALSLGLGEKELLDIGAAVGSDVPFFVTPHTTAIATGRGELLEPIKYDGQEWYVLVNPGFEVSTAETYASWIQGQSAPSNGRVVASDLLGALRAGTFWDHYARNDLESVTAREHPEVLSIKRCLLSEGAIYSAMSGSGPTVFGVFESERDSRRAFHRIRSDHDWAAWMVCPQ